MLRYRVMVRVLGSGRLLYQRIYDAKSDTDAVRRGVHAIYRTAHRRRIPARYLSYRIDVKRGLDAQWEYVTGHPSCLKTTMATELGRV